MEIKEMQKMSYKIIEDWNKKHNKTHNSKTTFTHLVEEVGELARELNHYQDNWRSEPNKEKLAEEIADVLDQLFILATDFKVDIEKAFTNKIKKLRKRFELD
jgi:NTP pyrophosphatase (non-canonical NTP hydrolase)